MQGSALIRGADGKMRALHVGDIVERGDVILTTQNGIVEMKPEAGPNVAATPGANDIDRVITGLNEDNPATAPAATLAGDGAGDLSPGLRVDRVVEVASASALTQSAGIATGPLPFTGTNSIDQTSTSVLSAGSSVVSAVEEGPSVNLGLPAPSGAAAGAVVTVTQVPAIGEVHKADGSIVGAGTVLAVTDLPGLQYVPPADYNSSANVGDFEYTVSSGGVTASGSASIDLSAVNDAPVATDAAASGLEDATLPISLGGQDVDGNVASVTVTAIPGGSTVLLADGVTPVVVGQALTPAAAAGLLFKPAPDFNGDTAITFTVTDDAGAVSAPASVALNVIAVDDAPLALADVATTLEDSPISGNVLVNDSDVDGPALSVSSFGVAGSQYAAGASAVLPGLGVFTIAADGSYSFTPVPNYSGAVPVVTYTATDGTSSASTTLSLSVTAVNDAPVAADDLASTPINTPITITVLANDSDAEGDALSVSNAVLADPTQGTLTVNANGTLSFTPASNFAGTASISYTVTDSQGGSSSASVTVNVGNNTPPTGADSAHALAEDGSYVVQSGDFGFADADAGQTLSNVRIDALPAAGALLLNGSAVLAGQVISAANLDAGNLVFVPAADASGAPYASFSFSVQDSAGAFDAAPNTLTLNVTPVNDAPVAVADNASALEAGGLNNEIPGVNPSGNVLANDTDVDSGDTQAVSAVVGAAAGTVGGVTAGAFGTLVLN
ncbi:tandem-95 repeat protein, partial [Piscinibacter sp.]|uniref:tandem-95 repeat protein n=1 Tax=Piscinibacter sp. TaxID=1903157 RepID=UPI002F425558